MTELPFADSTFDCVYATESLEHAVEIERAVNEMCRVLKPGGKLVIIDKNAEHWGKLKTPDWERWFTREELEKLLARYCRRFTASTSRTGKMCRRMACSLSGSPASKSWYPIGKARKQRLKRWACGLHLITRRNESEAGETCRRRRPTGDILT